MRRFMHYGFGRERRHWDIKTICNLIEAGYENGHVVIVECVQVRSIIEIETIV